MLAALCWIAFAGAAALYIWIIVTPRDIPAAHLVDQASISAVRQPGESAIYRHHINPHGRPLADGAGPARALRLQDLWEPSSFSIKSVAADGSGERTTNINSAVQRLGPQLTRLCNNKPVLLAVSVGFEQLALLFACSLYGLKPFIVAPTHQEIVESAIKLVNPGVIVGASTLLERIEIPEGTIAVAAGDKPHSEPSVVGLLKSTPEPVVLKPSKPAELEDVQFTFVLANNELQPVLSRELASALVAQMRALGTKKWSNEDRVLVFSRDPSPYNLLMQLTALSCKCNLYFVEQGFLQPFVVVKRVAPTILTTDDLSLRSLVRLADDFSPLKLARLFFARLWLSRGVLPNAVLTEFSKLRLVHTEALHDERYGKLEADECTTARACLGANVIHALTLPQVFGPIAQTRIGDYRNGQSDDPYVCFGAPVPGLEVKTEGPDVASAGRGVLLVRGPASVGGAKFTDLKQKVELRGDGCVYVKLPDPIKHDIYYG